MKHISTTQNERSQSKIYLWKFGNDFREASEELRLFKVLPLE